MRKRNLQCSRWKTTFRLAFVMNCRKSSATCFRTASWQKISSWKEKTSKIIKSKRRGNLKNPNCRPTSRKKSDLKFVELIRHVARNLHWGDVLEAGKNIKRSWPRFSLVFTRIGSVFLSKFRWSPTNKKRSWSRLKPSFSAQYHIRFLTNFHRQYGWGGYFRF